MSIHTLSSGTAQQRWVLETNTTAYVLGLNPAGMLAHCYWGMALPRHADYPAPPQSEGWASFNGPGQRVPEEYPAHGGIQFIEPCLKVTFADGVRDCMLHFRSAIVDDEQDLLMLVLADPVYDLVVRLYYRVHAAYDLIERWAEVSNEGRETVQIERAFSAQWHLPPAPAGAYRLGHLTGRHMDEFHIRREQLLHGVKVLESRRIQTSHHHNPYFTIDHAQRHATETEGEVWFGVLAWSGNWKIAAEVTDFQSTRVSIGINDWDALWQLAPGERYVMPRAFGGYTTDGFGGASRILHAYVREQVLPHGDQVHPVLYNSWEATLFNISALKQRHLAKWAAALGVELFVVDDGWFRRRSSDRAGLGDWTPDKRRFPRGLQPLIAYVNQLGMAFGLWVEPEMVSPDSDLYRAHPDWVLRSATRTPLQARNQLILNMARTDVQDYLIAQLDALLSENAINFIKWDMNRSVGSAGWPEAEQQGIEPREVWVRYVGGLYRVWDTLRARHPQVLFQSCSGGGGRADFGILQRADQIWVSDNTDAIARLAIQEGFSQVFPAQTMEAWVTDSGRGTVPLRFRFHVAMTGVLGLGGNLAEWTDDERAEATARIAEYKALRRLVQHGEQFRLLPVQVEGDENLQHPYTALQYMDADRREGVLFVFRTLMTDPVDFLPIPLQGLDPIARYSIEGSPEIRSGMAWMTLGVQVELKTELLWGDDDQGLRVFPANMSSTIRRIRRV